MATPCRQALQVFLSVHFDHQLLGKYYRTHRAVLCRTQILCPCQNNTKRRSGSQIIHPFQYLPTSSASTQPVDGPKLNSRLSTVTTCTDSPCVCHATYPLSTLLDSSCPCVTCGGDRRTLLRIEHGPRNVCCLGPARCLWSVFGNKKPNKREGGTTLIISVFSFRCSRASTTPVRDIYDYGMHMPVSPIQ